MSLLHPYQAVKEHAQNYPNKIAVGFLRLGNQRFEKFETFTHSQFLERLHQYAQFLLSLNLKPKSNVAIMSGNGVEWVLQDLAIISSGYVSVPLYAHSHLDEVRAILKEAEVEVLFCDEIRDDLPCRQISWGEVEEQISKFSKDFTPNFLPDEQTTSIIYSSGTSGRPKGVMHSMKNFREAVTTVNTRAKITRKDIMVSYLPLSHVVERSFIEMASFYFGTTVYYLDRVEKLPNFLSVIRPTLFQAVPRIWETVKLRLERELKQPLVQQRMARIPFFLQKFVLKKMVRRKLGLDRVRLFVTGAAKLNADVTKKMNDFGIIIYEGYGLTETLGVTTLNNPRKQPVYGSVGSVYEGVQLRFEPDGEMAVKANFHFLGYYKQPDLTAEAVREGWFFTGDIGRVDSNGNIFITDRKKDIFKTSSGKFVAPLPIEARLREHPALRDVLVLGEGQSHCIALASIDVDQYSEASLIEHLEQVNSHLPPHEQIKSIGCLEAAWTIATGELTPTMKIKRKVIIEKFEFEIQELYRSRVKVKLFKERNLSAHSSI